MEKEPVLMTSDLAAAIIGLNGLAAVDPSSYERAVSINHLAFKLTEQTGDQHVMATVLINAGIIHCQISTTEKSFALALDYFRKSLKIGEECGFNNIILR